MDEINLKQIITEFPDCVSNGAKLKAILLDTYPEISKAIVNTLVIMANSGIAKEIQESKNIAELDKSRWQKQLKDEGFAENVIKNSLDLLLNALASDDIDTINLCDFEIHGDTLIKYTGTSTTVNIPEFIKNIKSGAFRDCLYIENIVFPSTLQSIGDYAFYGCKNLSKLSIPNSVSSIGANAFAYCQKLIFNKFDNAYYLGNSYNPYLLLIKAKDTNILSCLINNKTKFIYGGAFGNCSKLEKITLPQNIKDIGFWSFYGCCNLKEIKFEGTTSIFETIKKDSFTFDGVFAEYIVCSDGLVAM